METDSDLEGKTMDDLDELIAESTERDPEFPRYMAEARARREEREAAYDVLERHRAPFASVQAGAIVRRHAAETERKRDALRGLKSRRINVNWLPK